MDNGGGQRRRRGGWGAQIAKPDVQARNLTPLHVSKSTSSPNGLNVPHHSSKVNRGVARHGAHIHIPAIASGQKGMCQSKCASTRPSSKGSSKGKRNTAAAVFDLMLSKLAISNLWSHQLASDQVLVFSLLALGTAFTDVHYQKRQRQL